MNVNAFLVDLPTQVRGQTVKNEDDSYSVFLNARLTGEQIMATYAHEIEHIKNGDFEKAYVQRIEAYAHHVMKED